MCLRKIHKLRDAVSIVALNSTVRVWGPLALTHAAIPPLRLVNCLCSDLPGGFLEMSSCVSTQPYVLREWGLAAGIDHALA